MKRLFFIAGIVLFLIITVGCTALSHSTEERKVEYVTVFAAASLVESLTNTAKDFEALKNAKTKIILNFAGSQALKAAVENGAKADIFISASAVYMDELKKTGLVEDYTLFLKNSIALVKNRSSGYMVESLNDLSMAGIKIAVEDKSVPVGMYWQKALDQALNDKAITEDELDGINKNIKTRELNDKDIVGKVLLNEVDYGVVYKTDITKENSEMLELVNMPILECFQAEYAIGALKESERNFAAEEFYKYILSDMGMRVFKDYGFTVIESWPD